MYQTIMWPRNVLRCRMFSVSPGFTILSHITHDTAVDSGLGISNGNVTLWGGLGHEGGIIESQEKEGIHGVS